MPDPARSLAVTLLATGMLPCPDDATWVCCLDCGASLELNQPDADKPRRFIGTCNQCGRWYLLDWIPLEGEGMMLLLPSYEELRATFQAGG